MVSQRAEDTTPGTQPPESLISGLRQLLRPLIRLLLRHHIGFPFLSRLLKQVYVEVALESLQREGQKDTDSRVSLLTGVHRKDVRALRADRAAVASVPRSVSLGARIIREWTSRADLRGPDGAPLPLPRFSGNENEPCFDALVMSVTKDIPARSVLDEWLRMGVAQIDAAGRVQLRVEGFVPRHGFDEKAFYFGRNVRDHIAAAAHNLAGDAAPMLERSVYYEGLSDASIAELEALAESVAMRSLREFNERARELKARDEQSGAGARRVTLGAYLFCGEGSESPGSARGEDE